MSLAAVNLALSILPPLIDLAMCRRAGREGGRTTLDRVPLLARRVHIAPQHVVDDGLERVKLRRPGGIGLRGCGQTDVSAARTMRRLTWYFSAIVRRGLSDLRWSLCVPGWLVVLDWSRRQLGPGSGGTWMGLLHMP